MTAVDDAIERAEREVVTAEPSGPLAEACRDRVVLAAEVKRLRRKKDVHCGCAWCCREVPFDQRGETHQRTCRP